MKHNFTYIIKAKPLPLSHYYYQSATEENLEHQVNFLRVGGWISIKVRKIVKRDSEVMKALNHCSLGSENEDKNYRYLFNDNEGNEVDVPEIKMELVSPTESDVWDIVNFVNNMNQTVADIKDLFVNTASNRPSFNDHKKLTDEQKKAVYTIISKYQDKLEKISKELDYIKIEFDTELEHIAKGIKD